MDIGNQWGEVEAPQVVFSMPANRSTVEMLLHSRQAERKEERLQVRDQCILHHEANILLGTALLEAVERTQRRRQLG